eukprot:COSAG01_NODE_29726_length_631_cov_0.746241_2_plen_39_part_01
MYWKSALYYANIHVLREVLREVLGPYMIVVTRCCWTRAT